MFAEPFLGPAGCARPSRDSWPRWLAWPPSVACSSSWTRCRACVTARAASRAGSGLAPDLTLLGKIIGGGFPIGAVGGRADLLELTVAAMTAGNVTHAGTFNGHLAAAVAGTMTLRYLDEAAITGLNEAAAELDLRIVAGATAAGVPAEVTRAGSIMNVHLGDPGQLADLHIALLLNGVYTTPRGMINLSTALSPGDLDDIAAAYATAFTQVRKV